MLTITSVAVSPNFAETNTCGATLAAGANCVINVTLLPTIAGSVSGTVSFTDNATGSPQTVPLSGTGTIGTPQYTLTGYCWGEIKRAHPNNVAVVKTSQIVPLGR
jgi:hypothetical protein